MNNDSIPPLIIFVSFLWTVLGGIINSVYRIETEYQRNTLQHVVIGLLCGPFSWFILFYEFLQVFGDYLDGRKKD